MRNWTFEHDNGRNPQTETARFYVDSWETMQAENIGYLFWGGVGTGKSYLAACIANALMEQEVPVCMTNFATILNDLAASFEGRNEYISRLCSYPLLSSSPSMPPGIPPKYAPPGWNTATALPRANTAGCVPSAVIRSPTMSNGGRWATKWHLFVLFE